MNPFELTKDPDGGGITVRVKHGFVVLTREEERRVTELITEILAENAKLRELVHKQDALTKAVHAYWAGSERSLDEFNVMMDANAQVLALMQELGIEVN